MVTHLKDLSEEFLINTLTYVFVETQEKYQHILVD